METIPKARCRPYKVSTFGLEAIPILEKSYNMIASAADPPKRDKDEIMTPSMSVEFHTPEPSPSPVSQCSEITIPSPGPDPAALDLPSKECRRTQAIYLPDLFASVMGMRNRVNPHYESVKKRSQAFVQR